MTRCRTLAIVGMLVTAGCNWPPVMLVPVEGVVVFQEGGMPEAAVARIYFEPVVDGPQKIRKVASGDIGGDGRFTLMTLRPADGVMPGRYRVFFAIEKTLAGRESLVPARYAAATSTPFEVTVNVRSNEPFRFEIERTPELKTAPRPSQPDAAQPGNG